MTPARTFHTIQRTVDTMRYPRNVKLIHAIPLFLYSSTNNSKQQKKYTSCQSKTNARKVPPLFGNVKLAKRLYSSELNTNWKNENPKTKTKDCPICAKYSKGPCGTIFQKWLKCTDDHPGTNESTGKELHVEKCLHLATPLAECLKEHQSYYDAIPLESVDESDSLIYTNDETESIREAWEKIVKEIEMDSKIKIHPFQREKAPEMEVRFESNVGVAWFDEKSLVCENGKQLLLAYMKDQNDRLLGAGTNDDIEGGGGLIRFQISEDTEYVTLCVLYGDDENGPLYTLTQRLPPR